MLDMAGLGGGRLRPTRHLSFTATNRQGLVQSGDARQIAFRYHNKHRSRCIAIIYHNTRPKYSLRHRVFGRHLDSSSRMQFTMDLMQTLLQAVN
jgi:hypothetical protein